MQQSTRGSAISDMSTCIQALEPQTPESGVSLMNRRGQRLAEHVREAP